MTRAGSLSFGASHVHASRARRRGGETAAAMLLLSLRALCLPLAVSYFSPGVHDTPHPTSRPCALGSVEDCSLNGNCVAQAEVGAAGAVQPATSATRCRCDPGWRGYNCSTLDLLPANKSSLGYRNASQPTMGGDIVYDGGKYHALLCSPDLQGRNPRYCSTMIGICLFKTRLFRGRFHIKFAFPTLCPFMLYIVAKQVLCPCA